MRLSSLWKLYNQSLMKRPLLTKTIMSIVVLGAADVGAQGLQHRSAFPYKERAEKEEAEAKEEKFSLDI